MGKQIMNGIVYGGVGEEYLSNLSDVELTNLQDGQGLLYDSALQKWVNAVVGSGGSGSGGAVGIRDVTSLISLHPGVAQNPDVNNFTYKAWQIGNIVFLHARGNLVGFSNPTGILYSMLDIDPSISPQEVYDGYALGGSSTAQRIRADTDNTIKISGVDNGGYAWIGATIYWRVADTYYASIVDEPIHLSSQLFYIGPVTTQSSRVNFYCDYARNGDIQHMFLMPITIPTGYHVEYRLSALMLGQGPNYAQLYINDVKMMEAATWTGTSSSPWNRHYGNITYSELFKFSDIPVEPIYLYPDGGKGYNFNLRGSESGFASAENVMLHAYLVKDKSI